MRYLATVLWYRYIKNIHQHGIKFHVLMIFHRFLSTSPRDDSLQKFTTEGLEGSVFKNTIWKETLNSYDNQFSQCQQNLSSSLTSLNTKRPRHVTLKIHVLVWDGHKNVAELNRLLGPPPPLLITGSLTAIHI